MQTPDAPTALAISEDSRVFALAVPLFGTGVTAIQTYAIATGKLLAAWPLNGAVTALAFGESSSVLIAAGFGAVFGTPLAGALFGLEVLAKSFAQEDLPPTYEAYLATLGKSLRYDVKRLDRDFEKKHGATIETADASTLARGRLCWKLRA